MLIPALIAILFGEPANFVAFLFGIGVCLFVGALLRLFRRYPLDRRNALLLVGVSWIVLALFASVPLYLSGDFRSFLDALFESVSSLTTTGASLARDIDHLGYSQVTWRAILTLFGGQISVIIAMYMGFFGEGGTLGTANKVGHERSRRPRISDSLRFLTKLLGVLVPVGTVVAFGIGMYLGLTPVDSLMNGLWLTANAISTGAFVPHTSSLVFYHSLGIEAFVAVLMLLGTLNFGIYTFALRGNMRHLLHNSEMRTFAVWLVALVVFVSFAMTREQVFTGITGLISNGTFMVISAATTGGMQTVYPQQIGITISDGVIILLALAAFFGASSFSSSGGIKVMRVMQALRWVTYSIRLRLLPQGAKVRVRYEHFGTKKLGSRDAMMAMTIFTLYIAAAALGTMAFIAHGNGALASVLEAISYVSNTGVSTGITTPNMTFDLKIITILLMWAGRLDFIALIAVFAGVFISLRPSNWARTQHRGTLAARRRGERGGTAWRRRKEQGKSRRPRSLLGRGSDKGPGTGALSIILALALVCAVGGTQLAQAATLHGSGEVSAEQLPTLNSEQNYRVLSIAELLSATQWLDGKDVSFSGEAIGSPIRAEDGFVWVNIVSNHSMIGVHMSEEQAQDITTYGNYATTGDTITVKGEFHLACAEHAGELEVHAEAVSVHIKGEPISHTWSIAIVVWAIALILLGGSITVLRRLAFGRERTKLFRGGQALQ